MNPRLRLMVLVFVLLGSAVPAHAQFLGGVNTPASLGSVAQPFTITGWAVDSSAGSGTGVDAVHIAGCPVTSCGTQTFWGASTYGVARPDVAAAYNNNNYLNSGYTFLMSGLAPGSYYMYVYAHSSVTGAWSAPWVVQFTATQTPYHNVDVPTPYQAMAQPFNISGWAIDASVPTGTGIDVLDVWAYYNFGTGQPSYQIGYGTLGDSRPDVAAVYGARFQPSGYHRLVSGQPAGWYWFVIGARTSTNQAWTIRTTQAFVDIPMNPLTITRTGTGTGAISSSPSGLNCPGGASTQAVPCEAQYAVGAQVTLTAVPDTGSTFAGWVGPCSGTGTCLVGVSGARHVTAIFTKLAGSIATAYYHVDVIGSVRVMTDSAGQEIPIVSGNPPITRHDYAPFGEDTLPLTGDPMRFAGKELDPESALHYFAARYYRNTWGRFTQVDPVGGAPADPQSWNRYAYAKNNPLRFVDPTGLAADEAAANPIFRGGKDCPFGGGTPGCPRQYPPSISPPSEPWVFDIIVMNPDNPWPRRTWPIRDQLPQTQTPVPGPCVGMPPEQCSQLPKIEGPKGTERQQRQVRQAVDDAKVLLRKPSCSGLLDARVRAVDALAGATFYVVDRPPSTVGAQTLGDNVVWVFKNGPFFITPPSVLAPNKPYGVFLSARTFGATLILHEVGHMTDRFGPDASDQALNNSYTTLVATNCPGGR